jgi:hypothetical protein
MKTKDFIVTLLLTLVTVAAVAWVVWTVIKHPNFN